jgi:hypothetical protein
MRLIAEKILNDIARNKVMDSMNDCYVYQTDRCKLIVNESGNEFAYLLAFREQGRNDPIIVCYK